MNVIKRVNKKVRFVFLLLFSFFSFITPTFARQSQKEQMEKLYQPTKTEELGSSMFSLVPQLSFPFGYVRKRHKYGWGMRFSFHKAVASLDKKTRLRIGINAAFYLYHTDDYKINFFPIYPEIVFTFGKTARVQPFLAIGGGLAFIWAENKNKKQLGNDGLINTSFGSIFYLKSSYLISFIAEAQYLILFEKDVIGHFVNIGLGIAFNFH